jgi:sulfite dehydrogenase (cytochrome) subunit A
MKSRYKIAIAAIWMFSQAACRNSSFLNVTGQPSQSAAEPMRVLSERPPQFETPISVLRNDITPNDYFFVRWHNALLPDGINLDTFKLRISGHVDSPLVISWHQLTTEFPRDSVIALAICAGNSRSTFTPAVPGLQWANGAMGNALWKGVKLKYLLRAAHLKPGAVDVTFQGMDRAALPTVPHFVRALPISIAQNDDVLVAYEMNGEPIPPLNGFPLKLVVPGWYASYWISALNQIQVLNKNYQGEWMTKAYLIPNNPQLSERPDALAKIRVPLTTIKLHSIFVRPDAKDRIRINNIFTVEGLAYYDGTDITKVEISVDSGNTWSVTKLNAPISKFAWRRWKFLWQPKKSGKYWLMARATAADGTSQPEREWNRSGYAKQAIDILAVNVH